MHSFLSTSIGDVFVGHSSVLIDLAHFLKDYYSNSTKIVLADSNTLSHCFPILVEAVPDLKEVELIEVEPGEGSKDLAICAHIWQVLTTFTRFYFN